MNLIDPQALWLGPRDYEAGCDSEEFYRDKMDHTMFVINHVTVNKMTNMKTGQIAVDFSIHNSGMRMTSDGEIASNPAGVFVAFHLAFLEIRARLPLHPYIRRVFREFGIAPAQLNPSGWRIVIGMYALWHSIGFLAPIFLEIEHYYDLYSHRSMGDGWWDLACRDKQDSEPLITGIPFSNKEWKKSGS
ncbi:hypothetical protein Dsin_000077 [Dipteronia sinensis]|uniref:Transposase (putative) gypsy type domain-containing protein n=1 Tax=Dipteronia sinensis TaxID=43782 RepID=A0AAD9ZHW6_9ROSI|nr:hypothetical protein Dsin_000077 [Dipteronia sinensis]